MNEKISVLIPVYNRDKYVEEAVRSIMNQTYSNLDILIYDDGSTDNTLSIIYNLAQTDNRITIVHAEENHGGVYAKCQLLNICNTEVVCYQDSDDISELNRIEIQSKFLFKSNKDASFCKWNWLTFYRDKWIEKINFGKSRGAGTVMFRLDREILPNPKFVLGGGDVDWIGRYLKKHPKWVESDEILYHIRNHEDRIGHWKIKIRKFMTDKMINQMSYSELIKYYKENYGK